MPFLYLVTHSNSGFKSMIKYDEVWKKNKSMMKYERKIINYMAINDCVNVSKIKPVFPNIEVNF